MRLRPLAIAALEDKIVQGATVMVTRARSMKATSAVSPTGFSPGEGRTTRWMPCRWQSTGGM